MLGLLDSPRTRLASAFVLLGETNCNGAAEWAYAQMRQPGRPGVRAVMNCYRLLPRDRRAAVLAEMYDRRVHPSGFGEVLTLDWLERGGRTARAAGTPERLRDWFRYARFDLPFLKPYCDVGLLPPHVTVWRGVRAEPTAGAAGLSWSPTRTVAAWYAHAMWPTWGHPAAPVLLRREIARNQVLAYYAMGGGEVVLEPATAYEIDSCDPEEIAALSATVTDTGSATYSAIAEEVARFNARFRSMDEDQLFAGWEG